MGCECLYRKCSFLLCTHCNSVVTMACQIHAQETHKQCTGNNYLFFKQRQVASIGPNVGLSVCLYVCRFFFFKIKIFKEIKTLLIFFLFDNSLEAFLLSFIRQLNKLNQKMNKRIKFLIYWKVVHTSYLKEGQYATDKDCWKFIIMYTNVDDFHSFLGWN